MVSWLREFTPFRAKLSSRKQSTMKLLPIFTIALTTLILFARSTSGAGLFPGDFIIESTDKDGNFFCDGLLCPKNTHSCDAKDHKDPKNPQQLIREYTCMDVDKKVLKVIATEKPNSPQNIFSPPGQSDLAHFSNAFKDLGKTLGQLFG